MTFPMINMKRAIALFGMCGLALLTCAGPCGGEGELFGVTLDNYNQLPPQWSPDGTRMVFTLGGLYTAPADGSSLEEIGSDGPNLAPRISPDGSRVAYMHVKRETFWNPGNHSEIMTVHLDGSSKRTLARDDLKDLKGEEQPWDTHPVWSPDGSKIAFESSRGGLGTSGLYTMAADGSDVRNIPIPVPVKPYRVPVSWSPDGKRLAFVGFEDVYGTKLYAYTVGIDGTDLTKLGLTRGITPAWSPDGNRIALVKRIRRSNWLFYTVAPDGSDLRKIADAERANYGTRYGEYLSWSPDGSKLLYSDGSTSIIDVDDPSLGRITLPNTRLGGYSSWSPDGSRIAINGRFTRIVTVRNDLSDRQIVAVWDDDRAISGSEWRKREMER